MTDDSTEFQEQDEEMAGIEVKLETVSKTMVYPLDWTVETIITQLERGNIIINPKFQRRDAWQKIRKSHYIESLFIGLPVPQIVLAEKERGRGEYFVLDGKQRMLSLLQFIGSAPDNKYNNFKLSNLEVRTDLNGSTYDEIKADFELEDTLKSFLSQPIRCMVLRDWADIDFLHLIFVRLNNGSLSLSPQELRQALFPGPFMDYIDDAASKSASLKTLLKIDEPDFRMRDVELLIRYLAFAFFLDGYAGSLKHLLDNTCDRLNKAWDNYEQKVISQVEAFEEAIQAGMAIFGEHEVGHKWIGSQYEKRLNKAIIDILAFYFSDEKIRQAALEKKAEIVIQFQQLCEENQNFKNAIEKTTNSLSATSDRLIIWGEVLKEVLGLNFSIPKFSHGKIQFNGFWR
ncbi:DUF262 domain-containing protein [Candidatus Parabeggiatoa sp. HSG14]|uniref:DUF262 domain-containing protein n=1 Tax=Candidatus Parabeggiatoa sp. HSG14 TaxID=3055593 RepID=UPI0025A860AE|nr:DUF262 domain-containing protein [Thiotrichales bacterium HSG14]